jgi:hypothetical protein
MSKSTNRIAIVGCGPRALSVALYIITYLPEYKIDIYDDSCLSTWTYPNILEEMQMRSPVHFDLVTNDPNMREYSLSRFLGIKAGNQVLSQSALEALNYPVSRTQFIDYLGYIKDILTNYGVNYVYEKANVVTSNTVNNKPYTFTVLTIGSQNKIDIPKWLQDRELLSLIKPLKDCQLVKDKKILVVGSGQSAAEYCAYFNQNNKVTWLLNKPIKSHPYPVPSYIDWGERSALSPFYKSLQTDKTKLQYLQDVRKWGPTITPNILCKIEVSKNITKIHFLGSREVKEYIIDNNIDFILVAIGAQVDLNNLPIKQRLERSNIIKGLPKVFPGYLMSNNVYVSGVAAVDYGGPRQGSLVSTGETSMEIIESMKQRI